MKKKLLLLIILFSFVFVQGYFVTDNIDGSKHFTFRESGIIKDGIGGDAYSDTEKINKKDPITCIYEVYDHHNIVYRIKDLTENERNRVSQNGPSCRPITSDFESLTNEFFSSEINCPEDSKCGYKYTGGTNKYFLAETNTRRSFSEVNFTLNTYKKGEGSFNDTYQRDKKYINEEEKLIEKVDDQKCLYFFNRIETRYNSVIKRKCFVSSPVEEKVKEEIKIDELECEGYLTELVNNYNVGYLNWNPDYDEINEKYPGCEDSPELLQPVSFFKNILRLNELERTIFTEHTELGKLGSLSFPELNKQLTDPIDYAQFAEVEDYLQDRWFNNYLDKDLADNLANIYFLNKQDELTWRSDLQNKEIVNVLKDIATELGDEKELEELSADELRLYIQTENEDFYNTKFSENIDKRFEQVKVIKDKLSESILRLEVTNQLNAFNYISPSESSDKLLTSRQTLYKYSKIKEALNIVDTMIETNACSELTNARQSLTVDECRNAVKIIKNEK